MLKPPPKSAPPPSNGRGRARSTRARWSPWSKHPDVRSVQIGVVATILVHLLLIGLAPKISRWMDARDAAAAAKSPDEWSAREFQIELAPDPANPAAVEPVPVTIPTFVEANPDVPDNVPDKTDFVAAQNQQVAQETPTPDGKSDAPAVEGEPDVSSTAIVSGQRVEPQITVRPPPPSPPESAEQPATPESEAAEQEAARRAQIPLPGTEKFEGDSPDGLGSNVGQPAPNASAVPDRIEGAPDGPANGAPRVVYFSSTIDPKNPQPRRTLAPDVVRARPSPLAHREFGTENIGAVAYNAKWSAYGEYLQKFIESVDIQWKRIVEQSSIYPVAGTKVVVRFRMDSTGAIAEVLKVESATGGRAAQDACVSAIVAREPYGAWPEDMIAVLGESQEISFTFHYN